MNDELDRSEEYFYFLIILRSGNGGLHQFNKKMSYNSTRIMKRTDFLCLGRSTKREKKKIKKEIEGRRA